jgi:hypothetical protein
VVETDLDGFKRDAGSSMFIKYLLGAYVSRTTTTKHLPNAAAVSQNITHTVPSLLVVCGLLQTVTIRHCGVSKELNTSGVKHRETCFQHLIPAVCIVLFKDCPRSEGKCILSIVIGISLLQVGTILLST